MRQRLVSDLGPLLLYIHDDDPRLARWREQATRAFSRVVADILWLAHQAERSGDDRPKGTVVARAQRGEYPLVNIKRFQDDDRSWVEAGPNGYVINILRGLNPSTARAPSELLDR